MEKALQKPHCSPWPFTLLRIPTQAPAEPPVLRETAGPGVFGYGKFIYFGGGQINTGSSEICGSFVVSLSWADKGTFDEVKGLCVSNLSPAATRRDCKMLRCLRGTVIT